MKFMGRRFITSESVTEGHPDKLCDQISDAVLDEILKKDPLGRVACETFVTRGMVVIGGEITTEAYVNIDKLARDVIRDIGYNDPKYGFCCETCAVVNVIGTQSPDIAQGVDIGGAGDQGLMVGYACDETPELMPLPLELAQRLTQRLALVRKKNILPYLGPDGKSQVTVEYRDGVPTRIETIVLSTQHTDEILDETGNKITEASRQEIIKHVIDPVMAEAEVKPDANTHIYVNPTGKFVVGGPMSDTGVTGRKIIVDTYGGAAPHGGGAFSGKDPTKVDRSAAYMARYIAKNIVAAGLAKECTVQLAYAIGVADPVGLYINTHGTGTVPEEKLSAAVRKMFDLTPAGIIKELKLRSPVYRRTAAYGHFGRKDFAWENTDAAGKLAELAKA